MSRINSWGWLLRLGMMMGGSGIAISTNCAIAQIIPDTTLPSNSIVKPDGKTSTIEGGTRVGSNLFHSFQQFSIPTGNAAFFNNAQDIQNIIGRVTGGYFSHIDGLIRANGGANLFLLNPNGIMFGPNARLNIGGSFVGSTASSIKFADNTQFSATASQTTPLLSISVPLGLQFGQTAEGIVNQSRATNRIDGNGLEVKPGKTLALVGGNVTLDGATMLAPGGRVELGAAASGETVGLTVDSNNLSLSFPNSIARADVALTNGSFVNVAAVSGGSIAINARNINLLDGSYLVTGIESPSKNSVTGDITLNATEKIALKDSSNIINEVSRDTTGNSGNININAKSLELENAFVSVSNFGQGNAGNVIVQATDSVSLANSYIYSSVESGGNGRGGNISISSGSLWVNNTQLFTSNFGQGNAGSVIVQAKDSVSLANSYIYSSVESGGNGDGGNINISSRSLSLTNGAQLITRTFGQQNAGSLNVDVLDSVVLSGTLANGQSPSGLSTSSESGATGAAGSLQIKTPKLLVQDGAVVRTFTLGEGNAGDIKIAANTITSLDGAKSAVFSTSGNSVAPSVSVKLNEYGRPRVDPQNPQTTGFPNATGNSGKVEITTGSLFVTNGAQLNTSTFGKGNAGNISVNSRNAKFSGFSGADTNNSPSGAFSAVQHGASGNGGAIDITTDKLTVDNGAQLVASTSGNGNAGDIKIRGKEVLFNGISSNGLPSGAFSAVASSGSGKGGNVNVLTDSLSVTNGAQLSASTNKDGRGDAGSIMITASDTVSFNGVNGKVPSGASSAVETGAVGTGGDLTIVTRRLNILNGAEGTVSNSGSGNAGKLNVNADFIGLDNKGKLTANSVTGLGGNVTLQVKDILLMRRDSLISDTSGTAQTGGDEGNLKLSTKFLVAPSLENNDILTNAFRGQGGRINILATGGIYGFVVRSPNDSDPQKLPTNDIVAISQTNPTIITPDIDPSRGLERLPTVVVNTPKLVASDCAAFSDEGGNSFTITGRGGLPPSPDEPLTSDVIWTDDRLPALQPLTRDKPPAKPLSKPKPEPIAIVPATGWVFNGKGEVTLISSAPNNSGLSSNPATCPTR